MCRHSPSQEASVGEMRMSSCALTPVAIPCSDGMIIDEKPSNRLLLKLIRFLIIVTIIWKFDFDNWKCCVKNVKIGWKSKANVVIGSNEIITSMCQAWFGLHTQTLWVQRSHSSDRNTNDTESQTLCVISIDVICLSIFSTTRMRVPNLQNIKWIVPAAIDAEMC